MTRFIDSVQMFLERFETSIAVVAGVFVHFVVSPKRRGVKIGFATLAVSSIFVAYYFTPAFVGLVGANGNKDLEIICYASTPFVSVSFLSLLVAFLPRVMQKKIYDFFGEDDDTLSEKK